MIIYNINTEEINGNRVKININLLIKNEQKLLWLLTEKENIDFFCIDRCDGIIVMLLPELLLIGEDIESTLSISEKLYYNLSRLIPLLVKKSKGRFKNIEIRCPLTSEVYKGSIRKNATGMSFGIDSLYSFYNHRISPPPLSPHIHASNNSIKRTCASLPPNYVVNLITFFNHGAFNGQYTNNQEQQRTVFARGREKVVEFAYDNNISYLTVDTNLDELYSLNYTKTHTFRTAGIAVCFQKIIKNYYYSSGIWGDKGFVIDPFQDSAYYDIFSLNSLGTENISLYSDGYENSRFEKTEYLANIEDSKRYLSVCWRDLDNCSACPKCIRTLAALELLGKIEEYSGVFQLEKYYDNHAWHWAKIISLRKKDDFYHEIYDKAIKMDYRFSTKTRLLAILFSVGRLLFRPKLLSLTQQLLKR